jgi:hypothetical protein
MRDEKKAMASRKGRKKGMEKGPYEPLKQQCARLMSLIDEMEKTL